MTKQIKNIIISYLPQTVKARTQQDELDCVKEIRFSTTVTSNDTVGTRRKGVDFRLLLERPEVENGDLFDVHLVVNWIIIVIGCQLAY